MRRLTVTDPSLCKACLQCVAGCSQAFFKEFDTKKACLHIEEDANKALVVTTCEQCGKCAAACDKGAITQSPKGVYMINKKQCDGCGKCVSACPHGLIVQTAENAIPGKCSACGICAKQCPMQILEVVE